MRVIGAILLFFPTWIFLYLYRVIFIDILSELAFFFVDLYLLKFGSAIIGLLLGIIKLPFDAVFTVFKSFFYAFKTMKDFANGDL